MSVLSDRYKASQAATAKPQGRSEPLGPMPPPANVGVPRTKTGTAWFSICAAAFVSVILVVFMLQNTGNVDVSFLWMTGQLPLALALFIAGIGVAIVASTVGAVRMAQLRHLVRTPRR